MSTNWLYKQTKGFNVFKVLVAHFNGQYTSPTRPVVTRSAMNMGMLSSENILYSSITYAVDPTIISLRSTATLTILNNTFTRRSVFILDEYELIPGVNWVVGGGIAASATNLAAAINRLPDFDAVAVGADITINGYYGIAGYHVRIGIINAGSTPNFSLNVSGYMNPPTSTEDGIIP